MRYVHLFQTADEFNSAYTGESYIEPWFSYTRGNNLVSFNRPIDPGIPPLTFEITSPGYINWVFDGPELTTGATIEYNKNGEGWAPITALKYDEETRQGAIIDVVAGDIVQFRGNNNSYIVIEGGIIQSMTGSFALSTCGFKVSGNIMSIINSTDYLSLTAMTPDNIGAFYGLFVGCRFLMNASDLILPATTLANYCYTEMFRNCTSLTMAPELPAETLASDCYENMFYGCENLNFIKCLATDINAENCTWNWVYGVGSTGTFVGVDGNPAGWVLCDPENDVNYGVPRGWSCNFEPDTPQIEPEGS